MAPVPPKDKASRPVKKSPAPITATSRLRNDYMRLMSDPVPYISAAPLPSNILEWHYVVTGPEDSVYNGGFYHGKVRSRVFKVKLGFKVFISSSSFRPSFPSNRRRFT